MFHYEVSFNRRLGQCACAIFWCLLSGGPIFGFAALKPILIKEHIYEWACDVKTQPSTKVMEPYVSLTNQLLSNVLSAPSDDPTAKCTPQDLKLNMMFTVGAVVTNVSALAIGKVLDDFGPRVCGLVGAFFLYVACFIFMFADSITNSSIGDYFDPYLIGYASMALGGPFAYISSFQLSNSFPKKSGTLLALMTGAFDASSAVFLVYRVYYNKTAGAFTLESFFKLYLLVPVFITVAQLFVMEKDSYKTPPETTLCVDDVPEITPAETSPLLRQDSGDRPVQHQRRDSIGDSLKQHYADEGEEYLIQHSGGIFGILHGYSARFQIRTPWFYLICLFATIQMLRLNYFVATIGTQYTYLLDSISEAEKLTKFFDIALPLGGVISIPFVGLFLDTCSTAVVLIALLAVSLSIGVLGVIENYYAGVINVLIFVAYRPFFYTSISDFCAKVFGFDTFGTVYGAIICTSGVFNFLQTVLDKVTHTTFKMNPVPINVMLVALTCIIGGVTVTYVHVQAKLYNQRKQAQVSA